jgi:hypothetical protein
LTVWPIGTNALWTVPLISKTILNMFLTFPFPCLTFFGLGFRTVLVRLILSFPNACLIFDIVSVALFMRLAWSLMLFHCWVQCKNRIWADTRHQMKGRKTQHIHWPMWNFVHWLWRYDFIIIYSFVALLQLLYWLQH